MSNQNNSSEIAKLVSSTDDIKSMIYIVIGSSIKDAGKKCFGLTLLEDPKLVDGLLDRLESAA